MNHSRRSPATNTSPPADARRGSYCRASALRAIAGYLLGLLIVSPAAADANETRYADAVGVFHCTFGEEWDVNYDLWPDRWVRQTGNLFPHYVNIEIRDDATATSGKCLQIDLDGASAAISTPPIRVMSRFSYLLEAKFKVEGIRHSDVVMSLDFYDAAGKLLQSKQARPLLTASGWQSVQITAAEPSKVSVDRAVIRVQVLRRGKGDIKGRVSIDDVWLARLPRISVSTNSAFNVYEDLNGVVVRCELSGIRERDPEIRFQLLDASSNKLEGGTFQLNGRLIEEDSKWASDIVDGVTGAPAGYEGATEWRPKIPEYGFYRVVVKMLSSESEAGQTDEERELDRRTVWLAVVPPLEMPATGDFGWTLRDGDSPLSFHDLSQLLPRVGVNWVKLPAWFDPADVKRGDELVRFIELLGASNIEVVGIIDRPPADSELLERAGREASIAELLSLDSSTWGPSLDPLMTRLSLRVRWWQLGADYDTSFMESANLNQHIQGLRSRLFRFGQDVRLGMSWNWEGAPPIGGKVTWDFQQYSTDNEAEPDLDENSAELLTRQRTNSAARWVFVEPPQRLEETQISEVDLERRAGAFVRRLVAAKVGGADAIFVSNPFNDKNGLMRGGGMPSELLLPWRTTAAMISGGKYLGELQLPGGSENRVFLRPDGKVVMVIWNPRPTEEVFYIGEQVRHIDVWGRGVDVSPAEGEQSIKVGPLPTFVLGLHEAITRWRMGLTFETNQVPSVFAVPHPNTLNVRNYFKQGVGGTATIVILQDDEREAAEAAAGSEPAATVIAPDRWSIDPPRSVFAVAANETAKIPFEIRLKSAMFGVQPVRIDFDIQADRQYQFSVYRTMEVGTGDLTLDVHSYVAEDGSLIVEQTMTNGADRLADFRCDLYAKGQRRQRMQVYRLGPNPDKKIYRYPGGHRLVGNEMLLEIEELNGPRVLKYRFLAGAERSADAEESTADDDGDAAPDAEERPIDRDGGPAQPQHSRQGDKPELAVAR